MLKRVLAAGVFTAVVMVSGSHGNAQTSGASTQACLQALEAAVESCFATFHSDHSLSHLIGCLEGAKAAYETCVGSCH